VTNGHDAPGLSDAVDVLVVNYRTPDLTVQAVSGVAGPRTSFFVRDNSADVDPEALRAAVGAAPAHLLADGRNTLYAAGNNELYQLGSAPFVLLLNPDVVLSREALGTLIAALTAGRGLWAVVPRLLNQDGSPQDYYRRFPTLRSVLADRVPPLRRVFRGQWRRHLHAGESFDHRRILEAPPGACLLLDRRQVGPALFDERLRLFFNDTDLCRRMADRGAKVELVPEATARHLRGASLAEARGRDRYVVSRRYDADCLAYCRKHVTGWQVVGAVVVIRESIAVGLTLLAGARVWLDRRTRERGVPN
jgi:N-acetylglucosaminyl-diphospho-decaprenol L-rhamnosyltransferase